MHALTKKNVPFQWTDDCETSFNQLKSALSTSPVLVYPKFGPGQSLILDTDASTVGLGAVLSQTQKDGTIHPQQTSLLGNGIIGEQVSRLNCTVLHNMTSMMKALLHKYGYYALSSHST